MATPKRPRPEDVRRAANVAAELGDGADQVPPRDQQDQAATSAATSPQPYPQDAQGTASPAERELGPARVLSSAVDPVVSPAPDSVVPAALLPGALALDVQPTIPPELDAQLNARERRTVWAMVRGASYTQALDQANVPPRAALRDAGPPTNVSDAVDAVLRSIAYQAGISRLWIIQQTVALYRRAAQAEEVLDRKGRSTGIYRFDGATAAKCLDMLADFNPELRPRRTGKGIAPGDVADLMLAVADRGRQGPAGASSRPPGRVLDMRPSRGDAAKGET